MSTRINRTPAINQLLERPATINPDKHGGAARGAEDLAVLPRPLLDHGDRIVDQLIERLVQDGPAADVGREVRPSGVACEVLVGEEG